MHLALGVVENAFLLKKTLSCTQGNSICARVFFIKRKERPLCNFWEYHWELSKVPEF